MYAVWQLFHAANIIWCAQGVSVFGFCGCGMVLQTLRLSSSLLRLSRVYNMAVPRDGNERILSLLNLDLMSVTCSCALSFETHFCLYETNCRLVTEESFISWNRAEQADLATLDLK
jgi:hypothetical protein